tara:strand:+ start:2290 stop:2484 length:195 start_codon:yes stop_codon:yes gene_type:complete
MEKYIFSKYALNIEFRKLKFQKQDVDLINESTCEIIEWIKSQNIDDKIDIAAWPEPGIFYQNDY